MGTIDGPGVGSPGAEHGDGAGAGAAGSGAQGGQADKRVSWPWRRPALMAGASVGAAALVFAGLGTADAMGATVMTTSQIASKVDPGLVDVVSTLGYQSGAAAGTGIVLTSTGEVLTNNHVIDGATSISVTDVGNGRVYSATVVGYDRSSDIAVLQLRGASGLKVASIGNSSKVRVGEAVVGIGNAGGVGGTPEVVGGSVTGLNRSITATEQDGGNPENLKGLIQVNADIQPGDSGGPLVDTAGKVLGMDTAASAGFSFQTAGTQGYAIP